MDSAGNPWITNAQRFIFRRINGTWQHIEGGAWDIGVGADNSVWVIGTTLTGGGLPIFRWNGAGWNPVWGGGQSISVGPDGMPWITNVSDQIWRRV